MKEVGYVLFAIYAVMSLWLVVNGIVKLHLWSLSKKTTGKQKRQPGFTLPFVTIQVPVFNEKYVVEGLLDCLAKLQYPKQRYEVIVLDDSTDETSGLIDKKVAQFKEEGLAISVVRRSMRNGYKAGALQEALLLCKGELIAIFDADFRPDPEFLCKLVHHFTNEKTGLVQTRWGHLNQTQNWLTRIQSFLLDTYFNIEMLGRSKAGYLTNFCGTAGIWRKKCIIDAGGWDGSVVSEDLDLSYRAQLKGWKIVYDDSTIVPAELPAVIDAFKIQQARWTKGIMQVFRKNWAAVAASNMSLGIKIHAFFHLSSSFIFLCLFINSLLALPLLLLRQAFPEFITLTNLTTIGSLNLVFLTIVFHQGVKASGKNGQFSRFYLLFIVVYMGLSVQNAIAVLQGMTGQASAFIRTPKYAANRADNTSYFPQKKNRAHIYEVVMLLYFLAGVGLSIYLEDHFFLIFFIMMSCGLGIIIFLSVNWRKIRLPASLPKVSWR